MTNLLFNDFSSQELIYFEASLSKKDKEEIQKTMKRYSSDQFIHYLLFHYPKIRSWMCKILLSDFDIGNVDVIDTEQIHYHHMGKNRYCDFVGKDNVGRIINIEVQNGGMNADDYDRFRYYGMYLVVDQCQVGQKDKDIQGVKQVIINTEGGMKTLSHYHQCLEVVDKQYHHMIRKDKLETQIYNIHKMREEINMQKELSEREQLMYLFDRNELHPYTKASEMILNVKEAHTTYLASAAERYAAYWHKVSEIYDQAILRHAKEEGEIRGEINSMIAFCQIKYPSQDVSWIQGCTKD